VTLQERDLDAGLHGIQISENTPVGVPDSGRDGVAMGD
jgi:hypothetical protein